MMSFRGDSKMKNHNQRFRSALAPRVLLAAAIVLFSCAFGTKVFADPEFEHSKIVYLLDAIGSSDLEFIRNGVEYTGKEAKAHLEEKMAFVNGRIRTAEDFINYIASESSVTGISYYVQSADGSQIEAGIWLRRQLAAMK
jgi:hypothetical protein